MKLSTKFFISVTALITMIMLGVVYIVLTRERDLIVEEMKIKGHSLAKLMAVSSVNPILKSEYATIRSYTEAITLDQDVKYVVVIDPQGVIKMHSNTALIGEILDESQRGIEGRIGDKGDTGEGQVIDEDIYEIQEPILASGTEIGRIQIGISTKKMRAEIAKSRNRIIFMGGIATLLGMVGSIVMGRTISRPIQDLVESTKAIAQGDLKIGLKSSSKDEVGLLTEAFQDMAEALHRNIQEMVKNEKLVTMGKMAATVAHEVKNPLEAIKGSAEYLRGKYPEDQTMAKFTTIIKDEIDVVARFLDEYLQYAKPSRPRFASRDINSILVETLGFLEKLVEQKRILVSRDLAHELPWILADALQIKQVFLNIILNAIEATPPDGQISMRTYKKKGDGESLDAFVRFDHVAIEISDTGKGISPENMTRLFDPFFSTKTTGNGLGLSISQGIIERHKGRIEIESELGGGALVRILLPI